MKRLALGILLCLGVPGFVSAGPAAERWRVIARDTDSGDRVAVAAAAMRRMTAFAVRVRVTGVAAEPRTARLHTVVTCSKAVFGRPVVRSRQDEFTVTAPAMRVLRLPVQYPENCGVTAIAIETTVVRRGTVTVEILARCTVQWNGACL